MRDFQESKFTQAHRMEQRTCLINLARRIDVFVIIATDFGKSLQLCLEVTGLMVSTVI